MHYYCPEKTASGLAVGGYITYQGLELQLRDLIWSGKKQETTLPSNNHY